MWNKNVNGYRSTSQPSRQKNTETVGQKPENKQNQQTVTTSSPIAKAKPEVKSAALQKHEPVTQTPVKAEPDSREKQGQAKPVTIAEVYIAIGIPKFSATTTKAQTSESVSKSSASSGERKDVAVQGRVESHQGKQEHGDSQNSGGQKGGSQKALQMLQDQQLEKLLKRNPDELDNRSLKALSQWVKEKTQDYSEKSGLGPDSKKAFFDPDDLFDPLKDWKPRDIGRGKKQDRNAYVRERAQMHAIGKAGPSPADKSQRKAFDAKVNALTERYSAEATLAQQFRESQRKNFGGYGNPDILRYSKPPVGVSAQEFQKIQTDHQDAYQLRLKGAECDKKLAEREKLYKHHGWNPDSQWHGVSAPLFLKELEDSKSAKISNHDLHAGLQTIGDIKKQLPDVFPPSGRGEMLSYEWQKATGFQYSTSVYHSKKSFLNRQENDYKANLIEGSHENHLRELHTVLARHPELGKKLLSEEEQAYFYGANEKNLILNQTMNCLKSEPILGNNGFKLSILDDPKYLNPNVNNKHQTPVDSEKLKKFQKVFTLEEMEREWQARQKEKPLPHELAALNQLSPRQLDAIRDFGAKEYAENNFKEALKKGPEGMLKKRPEDLNEHEAQRFLADHTRHAVNQLEGKLRNELVGRVEEQFKKADEVFNRLMQEQGFLGDIADGLKSSVGSPDGFINSKNTSEALRNTLQDARNAHTAVSLMNNFKGTYEEFIKQFGEKSKALAENIDKLHQHMEQFKESQESWTSSLSDLASVSAGIAAIAAAPVTGGASLLVGAAAAGTTKVAIKRVDALSGNREYSSEEFLKDGITGSLNGLFAGGSNMAGRKLTEQLLKRGASGTVDTATTSLATRAIAHASGNMIEGALDGGFSTTVNAIAEGDSLDKALAKGAMGMVVGMAICPLATGSIKCLGKAYSGAIKSFAKTTDEIADVVSPKAIPSDRTSPLVLHDPALTLKHLDQKILEVQERELFSESFDAASGATFRPSDYLRGLEARRDTVAAGLNPSASPHLERYGQAKQHYQDARRDYTDAVKRLESPKSSELNPVERKALEDEVKKSEKALRSAEGDYFYERGFQDRFPEQPFKFADNGQPKPANAKPAPKLDPPVDAELRELSGKIYRLKKQEMANISDDGNTLCYSPSTYVQGLEKRQNALIRGDNPSSPTHLERYKQAENAFNDARKEAAEDWWQDSKAFSEGRLSEEELKLLRDKATKSKQQFDRAQQNYHLERGFQNKPLKEFDLTPPNTPPTPEEIAATKTAALDQGGYMQMYVKEYDELRHVSTPYKQMQSPSIIEYSSGKRPGMSRYGSNWDYHSPNSLTGHPITFNERYSLNVSASKRLVENLDNLAKKHGFFYKTPKSLESWSKRHDPVTIYTAHPLNEQAEREIAQAIQPWVRTNGDELLGQPIKDVEGKVFNGIRKDIEIDLDAMQGLVNRAKQLDPDLATFVANKFTHDSKLITSPGCYQGLDNMLKKLESLKKAGNSSPPTTGSKHD